MCLKPSDRLILKRSASAQHSSAARVAIYRLSAGYSRLLFYLLSMIVFSASNGKAQQMTAKSSASTSTDTASYSVTEMGPNHRLSARVVPWSINQEGEVSYKTNRAYTELTVGMYHLVNGQWMEWSFNQKTPIVCLKLAAVPLAKPLPKSALRGAHHPLMLSNLLVHVTLFEHN
jgi:hypothetical protein